MKQTTHKYTHSGTERRFNLSPTADLKFPVLSSEHNPSLNTKFNKLNKYITIHCQSKVLELNRNMHSSAMHETHKTHKFTHPGTEKRFNLFPPANLQFLVPINYSKKQVPLVHYFRTKS